MSRKESILRTSVSLFAQRGFATTTTSSIAKEAGVAEGLIFHYFRTKEDILLQVLKDMIETYLAGSKPLVEKCSTGLEAVKSLIDFHFQFSIDNSEALLVLLRDLPNSFLQEGGLSNEAIKHGLNGVIGLLEQSISRGKEDGTIKAEIPPSETAFLLHGMLSGVSRLQLLEPIQVPDLKDQVIDFCYRSIAKNSR